MGRCTRAMFSHLPGLIYVATEHATPCDTQDSDHGVHPYDGRISTHYGQMNLRKADVRAYGNGPSERGGSGSDWVISQRFGAVAGDAAIVNAFIATS